MRVEQQWQELPSHFHLARSLKDYDCSPFERDFLAGTRLDYLHTLLLLGLVTQKRASDVDRELLEVASEMLSITVQVVILRDRLVNSGTCLIWKVCRGGVPIAGWVRVTCPSNQILGRAVWSPSGGHRLAGPVASEHHGFHAISTVADSPGPECAGCRDHDGRMDPGRGAKLRPLQPSNANNSALA